MSQNYNDVQEKLFTYLTKKGLNPEKMDPNSKLYREAVEEFMLTLSSSELESMMQPLDTPPLEVEKVIEILNTLKAKPNINDLIEMMYLSTEISHRMALVDMGLHKITREILEKTEIPEFQEMSLQILSQLAQTENVAEVLVAEGYAVFASSLLNDKYSTLIHFHGVHLLQGLIKSGKISQMLVIVFLKRIVEISMSKKVEILNPQNLTKIKTNLLDATLDLLLSALVMLDEKQRWFETLTENGFLSKLVGLLQSKDYTEHDLWPKYVYTLIAILTDDNQLLEQINRGSKEGKSNFRLKNFCVCCGKLESKTQTVKQCSQCKQVNYCSRDCQAKDWKNGHKSSCKKI